MNLHAKKSLGQNFLKSKKAIYAMLEASTVSENDTIIEIGPGKGAITESLLETGARVIAFELDQRMIEFLNEKFKPFVESKKLELIHQDILTADTRAAIGETPYKIVANIPYYITNLILRTLLSSEHQPTSMCLLVQREVAERIVARGEKESILSLSVKLYGNPRYVMKVSRKYFAPIPKVDSAIIMINDINRNNVPNENFEKAYFNIVKTAFAQKRKQAIKNLQKLESKERWQEIFQSCGIEKKIRAEDIPFGVWLQIVDKYLN